MTKTITLPNPQTLDYEKEFVLIPRGEYQSLIEIKTKGIREITLTKKQKDSIKKSEKELKQGEYFTLNELKSYLERPRSKTRR